jgi:enoyl-CoA hydratase/carnithine racemase
VTIAAVNGAAVGAGLNLALVCDIHVAAASAWFDCRFAAIGLHPGGGNLRMLQQLVGPQVAAAMALCRRRLDADEAQAAGLVLEATTDEELLTAALNGWIGGLFSPENRDATVLALVEPQGGTASAANEGARTRLKNAEEALRRLQAAIVAGINPAAVKEAINAAQTQRETARAALASASPSGRLDVAEVYAMVDALGDVGEAIKHARPESLTKL